MTEIDHTSNSPLKRCSKCGEFKPATSEYFSQDKRSKDGLYCYCKPCSVLRVSIWQKSNKEQVNAKQRRLYQADIENSREYSRNKQIRRARTKGAKPKRTRFITPDGMLECSRCHRLKPATAEFYSPRKNDCTGFNVYCKTCNAERSNERRESDRERSREQERERYQKNPERGLVRSHRRKARRLSLPDAFTDADWRYALEYFDRKCAVCGRPRGLWHTLAMDHWIPLSSPDCPGTIPWNIIPLCHGQGGCNESKHNRNAVEWLNEKFGPRKAKQILARIQAYFDSVKDEPD